MDIHQLEYAAKLVFAMCREHPEICPHDWSLTMIEGLPDGQHKMHYVCRVCDQTKFDIVDDGEYRRRGFY